MNREALKADAKNAMKQALISPYLVTVIMGIILTVLSVIQMFLDKWQKNTGKQWCRSRSVAVLYPI